MNTGGRIGFDFLQFFFGVWGNMLYEMMLFLISLPNIYYFFVKYLLNIHTTTE